MENKIDVNENLFEITKKFPSLIAVLVNKGFNQLDEEDKRRNFGSKITLKQAAELKNLDLAKLLDLMEKEIEKIIAINQVEKN